MYKRQIRTYRPPKDPPVTIRTRLGTPVRRSHTPPRSKPVDAAKEPLTRQEARDVLEHQPGCTCRPCALVDSAIKAAEEAEETFAPGARVAPVKDGEGCDNCEGIHPESCMFRSNH